MLCLRNLFVDPESSGTVRLRGRPVRSGLRKSRIGSRPSERSPLDGACRRCTDGERWPY